MKKILMVALCLVLVPILYAGKVDKDAAAAPDHNFTAPNIGSSQYTGSRSTPTLVDVIDLSSISLYCFGLTYDWERDGLWVIPFSYEDWVYCIQKTSPCTKIDSFQLVGAPAFHLGIGYAGGDVMYAMGYDGYVYEVDMTTGVVSSYRSIPPWPNYGISCGFNTVDDVIYGADWGFDGCSYAQPSQTGTWNTWALSSACGASGAYGASSPAYLFYCNEDATQAQFFQHSVTAGVPNTTPDSVWDCDPSQSQASTADCTFDGQYVYVLDQGDPDNIFIYDVGISGGPAAFWDFEDGWQGWTNTNGNAFPYAWGVEASDLNGASWVCPDAGDSSMWIDSDAAGSGSYLLEDTVQSPLLTPNPTMDWLKYGLAYNFMGTGEYLEAGIKYFDGATWTVVPLKTYTADFGPAWDSVDVSAYSGYNRVQIYFFYTDSAGWYWYGAFDNVSIDAIIYIADHDVGCSQIVSPPEGTVPANDYDVIGRIQNYGNNIETFDVTANVYDTVGMVNVFTATVTLTDFPVAGDSNVNFGMVTFDPDKYYYTEIYTELVGDVNPSNDTSAIYSTTAMSLGDIIFEMDIEAITGWSSHLGIEFDGTYFYVTSVTPTNVIHVIDTLGNLLWSIPQGTTTSWGMRDLAWDGVYAGADRIDTLYASDDNGTYQFGIDLAAGTMDAYPPFTGPPGVLPCRGLGWDDVDEWFFTANWDPLYKFTKDGTVVQGPVTGPGSVYGCAYDNQDATIWWHGQTGTYSCHLTQMFPSDMTMTGVTLDIPHTVSTGIAGGLCYYHDFQGMDVLFAIIQPSHIYGIFIRPVGIEERPETKTPVSFGFAPMTNPTKGSAISYITTTQGNVSLKVYDGTGRLVETLVNSVQPAGVNTVNWDTRNIANGVYFFKLDAEAQTATHKLILIK